MKRSRQLVIESSVVAALIIMIALGGTVSTLSLPPAWVNVQNPSTLTTQYDLSAFALFYNVTLSDLGNQNFSGVSTLLNETTFIGYPPSLSGSVSSSVSELGSANISIPLAISGFNLTGYLIGVGELSNASTVLSSACSEVENANSSFAQFEGPTSTQFSNHGVPVVKYSLGEASFTALITSLFDQCNKLKAILGNLTNSNPNPALQSNFTIYSNQNEVLTGGYLQIDGNLTLNFTGLANVPVAFFVNGTKFASATTSNAGTVSINQSIPFVYAHVISVWAVASPVQSSGFSGAVSNTLYFTVLFNETQIVVGDPPPILPTFKFNVSGSLNTKSGVPLPNAPVKVTSFGEDYFLKTNASGIFKTTLTVPANATDGIYNIYAAFAPQGTFGPSVNFTSIEVVHEPLVITLNPVPLAYSGLASTISGTVKANGTLVSGAKIVVDSPWGSVISATNGSGSFTAKLPVPLSAFGFSASASIRAEPIEAYISPGNAATSFGIFNVLWIVIPLIVAGIVVYEARNLGLLQRRKTASPSEEQKRAVEETVQSLLSEKTSETIIVPQMVQIYKQALLLAVKRYGITLLPSLTIREIVALVESSSGRSEEFRSISMMFEDYLYSRNFDLARVSSCTESLGKLLRSWSE